MVLLDLTLTLTLRTPKQEDFYDAGLGQWTVLRSDGTSLPFPSLSNSSRILRRCQYKEYVDMLDNPSR